MALRVLGPLSSFIGAGVQQAPVDPGMQAVGTLGEDLLSKVKTTTPLSAGKLKPIGLLSDILAQRLGDTRLVNQTVAPKGGVPRQANVDQAAEFALGDKMHQVQQARDREEGRSFLGNAAVSTQKRIGNAILGLPSLGAELTPFRLAQRGYRYATGQEQPSSPKLTVDDVGAGIAALSPDVTYDQARERIAVNEGAREFTHPQSTTLGNVAGDVLSIVAARVPMAEGVVAATKSPAKLEAIRKALDLTSPSRRRLAARIWASEPMSAVKRALGKAGEVGIEGSTLAYLHDGDPTKTALYGSAAQMAGSFALGAIKHPYYSMGTIAASAILWQMFKDAIPGGRDRILDSVGHATKVATVGTILGGFAGLFGAGRYRGSTGVIPGRSGPSAPIFGHKYAEELPRYAEGVNAAMRTGPNSLIAQFTADAKSKDPILPTVMDKLSTNVSAFTSAEIRRLSRAATHGKLRNEIEAMLKDDGFATRMGY